MFVNARSFSITHSSSLSPLSFLSHRLCGPISFVFVDPFPSFASKSPMIIKMSLLFIVSFMLCTLA